MSDFIVDQVGPGGLVCVFEDDGSTGYLYLYEPDGRGVVEDLLIYNRAQELNVQEGDVKVFWSTDGSKCAVSIWNGIRGIIDLKRNEKFCSRLESRDTAPIRDPMWLTDFP